MVGIKSRIVIGDLEDSGKREVVLSLRNYYIIALFHEIAIGYSYRDGN